MSNCDHIVGVEEDYDTGLSLMNWSDMVYYEDPCQMLSVVFKYCPMCGDSICFLKKVAESG